MQVVLGESMRRVVLRDAVVDRSEPYAGGEVYVDLHADGLDVTRRVFLYAFSNLEGFFDDLAASWRGWEGVRSWESPEADLSIEATFAVYGHAVLRFVVRDGPLATWKAEVDGIVVDAGEDLSNVARSIHELMDDSSA